MNELCLDEIKDVEFAILLEFRNYCERHGLSYFLSNGTLLGAVKYEDFIPWDDDVDVMMPRPDYERFLREYEDGESFSLLSQERNGLYHFPFAKLCANDTVKSEKSSLIEDPLETGLCIDIFPIDGFGSVRSAVRLKASLIKCSIAMLNLSVNDSFLSESGLKRFVYKICRRLGIKRTQFLYRLFARPVRRKCRFSGNVLWAIYGSREVFPSEVFSEAVTVRFRDEAFFAPKRYDEYLTSLYGDYQSDPPPEEQRSHHAFRAYRK